VVPIASLAHQSQGRSRFRISSRRGDAAYYERVRVLLSQLPGVRNLEVNPRTGSVLVEHRLDPDDLLRFAKSNDLFTLADERPVAARSAGTLGAVVERFAGLDRKIAEATAGTLDLAGLTFLFFAGAGLVQLARGQALAPASTLFWYAVSLAVLAAPLRQGEPRAPGR
jgi:hypothetical protein